MMLVIATQDHENYAAHQGFDGTYYWKAKGGSEYKITNIPSDADPESIVDLVRGEIEVDNEYFRTTILGYTIQPDTYLSWFEQSQLDFEGAITYPEPTMEYNELNGATV
jgi:hypothetical protein